MIRLAISVEGQTEREFITRLITPHLYNQFEIEANPIVITTKRVLDGPNHKGGNISIARITPQLRPLLSSFDYVTTFYDFYGFKNKNAEDNLSSLQKSIAESLGSPKHLIPYIQKYEFESLLFSSSKIIGAHFNSVKIEHELNMALSKANPEEINDSRETCPSKRIESACKLHIEKCYDKVFDGAMIAEKIGLSRIREQCPLFNSWLSKIEQLT